MTNQSLTINDYKRDSGSAAVAEPVAQTRLGALVQRFVATGVDSAPVILRLALAVAIFPHGAQKLLGWFGGAGFSGTIAGFDQYFGIAAPLAFVAIMTEFFAPIALALGLFARGAAAALIVQMLVAARFHLANGFFMNWYGNQAGEGFEYHLLVIAVALAVVVKGAGRWSVDRRIVGATKG